MVALLNDLTKTERAGGNQCTAGGLRLEAKTKVPAMTTAAYEKHSKGLEEGDEGWRAIIIISSKTCSKLSEGLEEGSRG